ncbi:unnamed protein product, partial [marine sediment metagenome]
SSTMEVGNEEKHANAEFIVKACNAHDELVEACKLALEFFTALDIKQKTISGLSLELNEALQKAGS